MTATCETCRYNGGPYKYADEDVRRMGLKCTRRAPVATGGMMSPAWTIWPKVWAEDSCGEHEHHPITEREGA